MKLRMNLSKMLRVVPHENPKIITSAELEDFIVRTMNRNEELQARIEKAIDYVDRRDLDYGSEEHEHLLNILRGEDK